LALLAWLLKILAIDRTQAWPFRRLPSSRSAGAAGNAWKQRPEAYLLTV
jgi:hypothetical protein